jgi:glycolate oxidase
MSKTPCLLTDISNIVRKYDLPFVLFGHAGDGNFHPKIMYERSDTNQVKCIHRVVNEIFRLTCDLGGTLSGEHGIGLAKAPFIILEHDTITLSIMNGLKRLINPNNILNPGKMGLAGVRFDSSQDLNESSC